RDARGEAVEAVDQVEGVREADDPRDRDERAERAERNEAAGQRIRDAAEPVAARDRDRGGNDLEPELRERAEPAYVVEDAGRDDDEHARQQRGDVPAVRCEERTRLVLDRERDAAGEHEGDADEPRHDPVVCSARVGNVEGAEADRERANERGERERRDRRHEGELDVPQDRRSARLAVGGSAAVATVAHTGLSTARRGAQFRPPADRSYGAWG